MIPGRLRQDPAWTAANAPPSPRLLPAMPSVFGDPYIPALHGLLTSMADGSVTVLPSTGTPYAGDDAASINSAYGYTDTVRLIAGMTYNVASPVLIPPWGALTSDGPVPVNNSLLSDVPATLAVAASFNAGASPLPAAVLFSSPGVVAGGQYVSGINLDGVAAPAGTHGIASYGSVYGVELDRVTVSRAPGTGLYVNFTAGQGQADGWRVTRCMFARSGRNVDMNASDMIFTDVHAIGATVDHNFYVRQALNSIFTACRGGNAAGNNWNFPVNQAAGQGGFLLLNGCDSDSAAGDGVVISYLSTGGPYMSITGLCSTNDGTAGGHTAVNVLGTPVPLNITGLFVVPGASSPATGLAYANVTAAMRAQGIVKAVTTAVSAGAGNTGAIDVTGITSLTGTA